MITVITDNVVKGSRDEYVALSKAFAGDVRANDHGCLGIEVYVDDKRPDHVVFLSSWETEADWNAHVGGESFKKHIPAMGPYYGGGTDTILRQA